MTIDDYIQYWACLCESEDGSYVIQEKRNRRLNRSNHIDKNLHHLNTPDIRKVRDQRIKTSLSAMGQHKDFLDVFADGRSRSLPPIRYRGIAYRVWLEEGDEMYGATHIAIKHLIDGGTAFSGGFTFEQINNGISDINKPTFIKIDGGKLTVEWTDASGIQWRLIAFFHRDQKKWKVNTFYTVQTGEDQTVKMVQQKYPPIKK